MGKKGSIVGRNAGRREEPGNKRREARVKMGDEPGDGRRERGRMVGLTAALAPRRRDD